MRRQVSRTDSVGNHSPHGLEWEIRQDALRIDLRGIWLQPDEIITLERYQSIDPSIPLADKIRWLVGDGPFEPSLDFSWSVYGDIGVEMKRVGRAEYVVIRGRIIDAIKRAQNDEQHRKMKKENFLIDIGEEELTSSLNDKLSRYNLDTAKYPLARLWILWDSVKLSEIELRK